MNKPFFIKKIGELNVSEYVNFLKKNDLDFEVSKYNQMYNRPEFFIKTTTSFILKSFSILNNQHYQKIINTLDLLEILEKNYGSGKIYNMQVAKLCGTGEILEHIDIGLSYSLTHRVHIPLVTNENVIFNIEENEYNFKTGEIIEINNLRPHSVKNNNPENHERLHIVLDYCCSEYFLFFEDKKKESKLTYYYQ